MTTTGRDATKAVELSVRVDTAKRFHSTLAVLNCVCSRGSRNCISPGDRCIVHIRPKAVDVRAFCDALAPATAFEGGGWKEAQRVPLEKTGASDDDGRQVLVFRTSAEQVVERNRRGVRIIECDEVVSIGSDVITKRHPTELTVDDDGEYYHERSILDKGERHQVFARWLVDTYGAESLSIGSGVLDVAGGQGQLSSALHDVGVPAILLDPNPRCDPGMVQFNIIAEPLVGDGSTLTNRNDYIGELMRRSSFVAGMHPDQATEPAIDLALRLGVPFAVLPCCVMPSLFPHRRQSRDGDSVRSYSSFCQYLMGKAPAGLCFYEDYLPFAGRNKVIFMKCQDVEIR